MKKIAIALLMSAFLTACSSTGSGVAKVKESLGLASGSSALASETDDSLNKKLVKGKTTQQDVEKMFGKPYGKIKEFANNKVETDSRGMVGGNMVDAWTYNLSEMSTFDSANFLAGFVPGLGAATAVAGAVKGSSVNAKFLVIQFDSKGKVLSHRFTSEDTKSGGFL